MFDWSHKQCVNIAEFSSELDYEYEPWFFFTFLYQLDQFYRRLQPATRDISPAILLNLVTAPRPTVNFASYLERTAKTDCCRLHPLFGNESLSLSFFLN